MWEQQQQQQQQQQQNNNNNMCTNVTGPTADAGKRKMVSMLC